jgi:hypothetical protein
MQIMLICSDVLHKKGNIVNLADDLSPPVGTISLPAHSHELMKNSSMKILAPSKQGESGSIDI